VQAQTGGAGEVILGFRTETAHLTANGALQGTVYATNMHGSYTMVSLNLNGGEVVHIRADRALNYPVGTPLRFDLDAPHARYFDPQTEAAIRQEVTA